MIDQLHLFSKKNHGQRYDAAMMKTAVSLYLRSRNCYEVLREHLHLPHPNTIKSYFWTLNTAGNVTDSRNTITTVFSKALVEEIYVKPAVRYQANHIRSFSHDEPTKAARTVLAIIIAPMMGAPGICLSTNSSIFSKTQSFVRTNAKIYHSYSLKRRLYLSSDGWQSDSESSMF